MRILTVIGTRPQFIKAAPVSKALKQAGTEQILVNTGQHYDYAMSGRLIEELDLPLPDADLEIGSGSHARQTAQMMTAIETEIIKHQPDMVLVYGDTNSTLAAALVSAKLDVPVAHVEAGLRSFNRSMPEEHNRVLVDHCSSILFAPTESAVSHLANEGITANVHCMGDVMYDAFILFSTVAGKTSDILETLNLQSKEYVLLTLHRPSNVDDPTRLAALINAFKDMKQKVVFPVHPRTARALDSLRKDTGYHIPENMMLHEPFGYLDMLAVTGNAALVATDSGGLQKEAFWAAVPCVTIRPETEWMETMDSGWNVVGVLDPEDIRTTINTHKWPQTAPPPLFGDGHAAEKIAGLL